jgi:hypothetical protein
MPTGVIVASSESLYNAVPTAGIVENLVKVITRGGVPTYIFSWVIATGSLEQVDAMIVAVSSGAATGIGGAFNESVTFRKTGSGPATMIGTGGAIPRKDAYGDVGRGHPGDRQHRPGHRLWIHGNVHQLVRLCPKAIRHWVTSMAFHPLPLPVFSQAFAPYNPLSEPAPVLLLEADSGITLVSGNVSSWLSKTGQFGVSQGTAANQPLYVSADDAFRGMPCVSPDGTNDVLDSAVGTRYEQPNTWYFVFASPNVASANLWEATPASARTEGAWMNPSVLLSPYAAGSFTTAIVPLNGDAAVACVVFDSSNSALYVPGYLSGTTNDMITAVGTGNCGTDAMESLRLFFDHLTTAPGYSGKMAAIACYNTRHDAATRTRVGKYLSDKYLPPRVIRVVTSRTDVGGATSLDITNSFSPGELLVAIVLASGNTNSAPSMSDPISGVWHLVGTATVNSGASTVSVFVRRRLCTDSSSLTCTVTPGASTSGIYGSIVSVAGMTKFGSSAVRGFGKQDSQAAFSTPAPALPASALSSNLTIGGVAKDFVDVITPPTNWTEDQDTGGGVKSIESVSRRTGFTGTTVTWGSAATVSYGSFIMELNR